MHALLVELLGVESDANSLPCSTCSTNPLDGLDLRDSDSLKAIHACLCVVSLLFDRSAINDVAHVVDCKTCLGNVGGVDDLSVVIRRLEEGVGLLLWALRSVEGHDDERCNLFVRLFT